jgi:excisionase family DNA binding protein
VTPRINTADYVTPSSAARLAGVSRAQVYAMIRDGRLASVEIDGTLFVRIADARKIILPPAGGRGRKRVE